MKDLMAVCCSQYLFLYAWPEVSVAFCGRAAVGRSSEDYAIMLCIVRVTMKDLLRMMIPRWKPQTAGRHEGSQMAILMLSCLMSVYREMTRVAITIRRAKVTYQQPPLPSPQLGPKHDRAFCPSSFERATCVAAQRLDFNWLTNDK